VPKLEEMITLDNIDSLPEYEDWQSQVGASSDGAAFSERAAHSHDAETHV
jgi:hypothetical protein